MKSKITFLALIGFILMIALMSIDGTVRERQKRQIEADNNIAKVFAGQQVVVGPFVVVKYRETWTEKTYDQNKAVFHQEKQNVFTKVYFPSALDYTSFLPVEERSRGIYKTQIYRTTGRIDGTIFIPNALRSREREGSTLKALESHLVLSISDIRGFSDEPKVIWNGEEAPLAEKAGQNSVRAAIPLTGKGTTTSVPFSVDLKVHGLKGFYFAPIASRTHFKLKSSWPHPSFTGNFLPVTHDISDKGFTAEWNVSAVASTAQSHIRNIVERGKGPITSPQTLGVELIKPSNSYSLTDRALKYAFLFIGCTFAAFFLFETLGELKIHPVQYGFVGLAQSLFFLLLLSLSEHISFGVSYLAASSATVISITYYLISVLKGMRRGLLFGGGLLAVYGALYGLLMSEDHALVIGSILVFTALASVMAQTRTVDWYAIGDAFDKKDDNWKTV